MPIPSWDQVITLVDHIGTCGVTLVLLVWHMAREERSRKLWERRYNGDNEKEEK